MPYDDIRFSGWDGPDDEDSAGVDDDFDWANDAYDYSEIKTPYNGECVMCGKERVLNVEGYCSSCWQIWNS